MEVKVNTIKCAVFMSEEIMPSLMMTLIVSEESLARDRHTHRHKVVYIRYLQNKTSIPNYVIAELALRTMWL